ncbi:hypothetical protein KP509_14G049100 [Ceratopteris richardii]|uniref:Uncharacterized protein n=1 Tax=Ceratopteris richardii TaxID=49495 RepID=A0A8T2T9Z2_CERRI|nr:hypothetical protein KP509_14G049100 [Ceratopteris richardii]
MHIPMYTYIFYLLVHINPNLHAFTSSHTLPHGHSHALSDYLPLQSRPTTSQVLKSNDRIIKRTQSYHRNKLTHFHSPSLSHSLALSLFLSLSLAHMLTHTLPCTHSIFHKLT